MRRKHIIYAIVIMMFCQPLYALANNTQQAIDMADSLHELEILKGNGNDYDLKGQLKRSEAAAFLTRMLGVEAKVKEDKHLYLKTRFIDVDSNIWYAYYIGYITQAGYVSGFDNNTFRPNDYVTQKQFTKLILAALNYRQGIDYEWKDIYSFAHTIGLYDETYKNKTEDNTNYTREEAINLMYHALDKNVNHLNKTMINKLIDKKAITVKQALEAGLLKDQIKTAIETVTVMNENYIQIALSEAVNSFDKENIKIYNTDNKDKSLKIISITQKDNNVIIETEKQEVGFSYTVELIKVEDEQGFKEKNIMSTFKGYEDKAIKSDYFKLSKVKAISKNVINVYYTHPITMNAAMPLYYTITGDNDDKIEGSFDNISVALLGEVENGVSIFLKDDDLDAGVKYTIDISEKVSSKYGAKLNDGNGESAEFIGNTLSNMNFFISDVVAMDLRYIYVTFNKDIDASSATNINNYKLEDKTSNQIISRPLGAELVGEGDYRNRKVKLRYASLAKTHEYELTIDGVEDSFKQMELDDEKYPFYGYIESEEKFGIDYAYAEDQLTVKLFFNEHISGSPNFMINGATVADYSINTDNNKEVTIYLDKSRPLQEGTNYTVRVINLRDVFNQPVNMTIEYTFEGSPITADDLDISTCKVIADNLVYIEFNKGISYRSTSSAQFRIEYKDSDDKKKTKTASSIRFIGDNIVIAKFGDLDSSTDYQLVVNNIKDFAEQYTHSEVSSSIERE